MIEASKETPIHMQILFAVLMGLRRSEINGLKYSDVDYIHRTLRVERQLGKKPNSKAEDCAPKMLTKQEIKTKTPAGVRELPIPDYVFEAILEERKTYEKNRRRRPKEFRDWNYICCSTYGNPRSKGLYKIIYVFLTIFLYLLKCPQSLILSALRAFCFCGKPHISRSIFLYFRYQAWLKSW